MKRLPTIDNVRTAILILAAVGCLIYAFIPPGNPTWIGTAGALLGGEVLVRAKDTTNQ